MLLLILYIVGAIVACAVFTEFFGADGAALEVGFFSLLWPVFLLIVIPMLAGLMLHLLALPIRFLIQKMRGD